MVKVEGAVLKGKAKGKAKSKGKAKRTASVVPSSDDEAPAPKKGQFCSYFLFAKLIPRRFSQEGAHHGGPSAPNSGFHAPSDGLCHIVVQNGFGELCRGTYLLFSCCYFRC